MSQEQERNQAATPHKLREAKKRGQVAKSNEASYAAILAVLAGMGFASGADMAHQELALFAGTLSHITRSDWSSDNVAAWLTHLLADCTMIVAPLLLALCLIAVLANVAQTGGVFSFDPLKPDFSKLNPATGLKRLFSIRVLYEAARSVIKLVLLGAVAWTVLKHLLPQLVVLNLFDARGQAAVALGSIAPLVLKLFFAVLLIAAVDVLYTSWDYAKKMRMSHRDITDEHKQKEGDPRIRSRHRQLRAELLKQSQSLQRVPEADVVITNPTHLAVALSYRHGQMPAPMLLAKGKGEMAAKMRALARQHAIPLVENPPLARALFKRANAEQYVPEDLYPGVARILMWIYAMRKQPVLSAAKRGAQ